MSRREPAYRLFEVTGIELEYPTVDKTLAARCLVEPLFREIAGRPTSEVEHKNAVFSNELAAHVFEVKTRRPQRSLARIERQLVEGVRYANRVLRDRFNARLLPTGMHPFLDPATGRLWPRAGKAIYQTYASLFPVRSHGWMNVQSSHVNLPFGSEPETTLLHNAIACLLPYLPALTASSPICEGKLGPYADNRLAYYRSNQQRIPVITGTVVPEYMWSYAQYRRDILGRIYRSLERVNGAGRLRHEWVNSRGAILRFSRRAIEIRTLDSQECVKMDVAVAALIRGSLKVITRWLRERRMTLPDHGMLVRDFDRVVAHGRAARVEARHLRDAIGLGGRVVRADRVLLALADQAEDAITEDEHPYLALAWKRLCEGNLSERIRGAVLRRAKRSQAGMATAIRATYEELAERLEANEPW